MLLSAVEQTSVKVFPETIIIVFVDIVVIVVVCFPHLWCSGLALIHFVKVALASASCPNPHRLFYCGGGFRSALSAAALVDMGYRNVWSLDGGWKGWVAAGLPVRTPGAGTP